MKARVLPVDREGRVLLLRGRDPSRPDDPYWFTIGGAVEPGESLSEAAAREMREEVGIVVDPALLGAPVAMATVAFSWSGKVYEQNQAFFAFPMDGAVVSFDGQEPGERATIDSHGWLLPEELETGGERPTYPELPHFMRLAVAAVRARHDVSG